MAETILFKGNFKKFSGKRTFLFSHAPLKLLNNGGEPGTTFFILKDRICPRKTVRRLPHLSDASI